MSPPHFVRIGAVAAILLALVACESNQRPPLDPNNPGGAAPRPRPDGGAVDAAGGAAVDAMVALDAGELGEDATPVVDAETPPDVAEFEQVPFAVETRVGERHTPVGLENRVTCQVLDQQGAPIPGHRLVAEVLPDTGFERTEIGLVGAIARDYRVTCFAPDLGLRDPTPADWTVMPGPAATAVTVLSTDEIVAGESVDVACEAYDGLGNRTPDRAFEVHFEPPPSALERRGDTFHVGTAGAFEVRCALPGRAESVPAPLTVHPRLPARVLLALNPDRPVYRVGQIVELVAVVTDIRENPIRDAAVAITSEPPLPTFGDGRFRCVEPGRYTLRAEVTDPTEDDRPVAAEVEILVDFAGPGITCESPAPGGMLRLAPGQVGTTLLGKVADLQEIQSLMVDGRPVDLAADGSFRADVEVGWGLNVHEVVASDGDVENSTLCVYYAAEAVLPEAEPLADALVLRLGQGALDDGEPDRPLASLADVLRRVVNSAGLRDTVHAALLAQNPVVPNECRLRVLGACVFRLGVEYEDIRIGGRNELELTFVEGGLRARVVVRDFAIFARLRGTLGNRARISTGHITIDLTFNVGLGFRGQPDVSLRGVNEVALGRLDSDFSGFITGAILELVFSAFEGLIRRTATDALRDFLVDNIDGVLTDLLNNVQIGELAQGIEVPSLTGGPGVPLTLVAGLSRIDFGLGRAYVGVHTRVDGPARVVAPAPGPLLPPGGGFRELASDRTVGASVQIAVLNQVLHRLWRAGYFDAEAGGLVQTVAGDLPAGAEVFLRVLHPPVVTGVDGAATLRIFLGPANAGVIYPGFFAEPFRVSLTAALEVTVRLIDERDLSFEGVEVTALHLALGGVDVPQRAREILEDTLRRVVQAVIDRALNDGLPVLPLPEFVIPPDLARFDLPAGAGLGLRQPRLTGTTAHWLLDGNFAEGGR